MTIEFMWKTDSSNTGNCPALYRADGGFVVQGKRLSEEDTAKLRDLDAGETGVWVPADVLDRLRETT